MPKISSPSVRPLCAYDSLLHNPLQQSQIEAIRHFFKTQPVWNGKDTQGISDINQDQDVLFLIEALLRRSGYNTIEKPKIDLFETRGRTIYNTQPINTDTAPSQTERKLGRRLSEVINYLDKLIPKGHTHRGEDAAEFVAARKVRMEAQSKHRRHLTPTFEPCSNETESSPGLSRSERDIEDFETIFLALTKGVTPFIPKQDFLQETELISEAHASKAAVWSRSPTPSLSWSVSSVNSSPGSDTTMDWDEECSGPEIIATEPRNYQPEGSDAAEYARILRFSYDKRVEAEEFDDSLLELFVHSEMM